MSFLFQHLDYSKIMKHVTLPFKNSLFQIGSLAVTLFLIPIGTSLAGDISTQASISETGIWDSNPLMISRDRGESIYGSETKATYSIKNKTPTVQTYAKISAIRNQFNDSDFNSTDFHGNVGITKKTPRLEASIKGDIDYDTTRTSELTTFDQNITSARHLSYSLRPSISHSISKRSNIALSGRWKESKYDDSSLSDYRILSIVPSASYNITPLQQATVSFQTQRYQSLEDTNAYTDSLGPSIAWKASLTPTLSTELSAGFLGSESHGYSTSDGEREWNQMFSGKVLYSGKQHTSSLSARRSRQPYANGTEAILTTFSAQEKYQVNPKLSLTLGGRYRFAEQSDLSLGDLDKMWEGKASLSYEMSKKIDVDLSYKYKKEILEGTNRDSKRNIARAGLTYKLDFEK